MTEELFTRGNVLLVDWQKETDPTSAKYRFMINILAAHCSGYIGKTTSVEYNITPLGIHTSLDDIAEAFDQHPDVIKDGVVAINCRILLDMIGVEVQFISSTKVVSTIIILSDPEFILDILKIHYVKFAGYGFPEGALGQDILTELNISIVHIDLTIPI